MLLKAVEREVDNGGARYCKNDPAGMFWYPFASERNSMPGHCKSDSLTFVIRRCWFDVGPCLDIVIMPLQVSRLPSSGLACFLRLSRSVEQCGPTPETFRGVLKDRGKVGSAMQL